MRACECQVELFVRRICADWDRTPKNMQKALGYKEALTVHIACGMYQHYLECLRKRCPATEYPAIASKLETMFMSGLMDPDLVSSAENNVPPGDVCSVSQFRSGLARSNNLLVTVFKRF